MMISDGSCFFQGISEYPLGRWPQGRWKSAFSIGKPAISVAIFHNLGEFIGIFGTQQSPQFFLTWNPDMFTTCRAKLQAISGAAFDVYHHGIGGFQVLLRSQEGAPILVHNTWYIQSLDHLITMETITILQYHLLSKRWYSYTLTFSAWLFCPHFPVLKLPTHTHTWHLSLDISSSLSSLLTCSNFPQVRNLTSQPPSLTYRQSCYL